MRILLIAHAGAPWTPYYGRHFLARGDAVLVVSFEPADLDDVPMEFVGIEPYDQFKHKQLFLTRVPRIRRIIRRFAPDVVMAPYLISNGLTAALSWSGPLVVSARGTDVAEPDGPLTWKDKFRPRVIRYVCRRADVVHAVSHELAGDLARLGAEPSKMVVFPTGIRTDRFRPAPEMPRPTATRLICTRKHEPVYDIPTIIEALIRLQAGGRTFHCTFVGKGHLLEQHRAQAREGGIADRVTFLGHVRHEELPGLLRDADIYISASHRDGTSSSLLEAMGAGLLPVVTRIAANEAWLEDGRTALMFDTGRADELTTALERAMDDGELRRRAMQENRARVERDGDMIANMERLSEIVERLARGEKLRWKPAPQ